MEDIYNTMFEGKTITGQTFQEKLGKKQSVFNLKKLWRRKMARGIFEKLKPEDYLELAEANVRFINTKMKKAQSFSENSKMSTSTNTFRACL